jgi:cytochrome P450
VNKAETMSHMCKEAVADPSTLTLGEIDLSSPDLFYRDNYVEIFEHLRDKDPVHLQKGRNGAPPFWNVTRYEDVLSVDVNHAIYSSRNSSFIEDMPKDFAVPMFLAMDPPRHTTYRAAVQPAFAAPHLQTLEQTIRSQTRLVLDGLPLDEEFDWVGNVSIELTSRVLAAMFDFPLERRNKLTEWSDLTVEKPDQPDGSILDWGVRKAHFMECMREFTELRQARAGGGGTDLVSLLGTSHGNAALKPSEFLGNVLMLMFAGNDTTRNSMSGGVVAFDRFPDQFRRLQADHTLLVPAVQEIFRWQTPVAYMRRVAVVDTELGGKRINAGDKVVIWYASGNRDERVFVQPNNFMLDRGNLSKHLAFGYGIHRCMGLRLAAMQLSVLWQEILERYSFIEVVGEPKHVPSSFVKGYSSLPVKLHRKR